MTGFRESHDCTAAANCIYNRLLFLASLFIILILTDKRNNNNKAEGFSSLSLPRILSSSSPLELTNISSELGCNRCRRRQQLHTFARTKGILFANTSSSSSSSSRNNINVDDDETTNKKNDDRKINEIIVVNWDGCLADTIPWRIENGIRVANNAWPGLMVPMIDDDNDWLKNKLSAIAHVFGAPQEDCNIDISRTCEYALAARLIIEEQKLDQGRSKGTGKYGGKFHPKQQKEQSNDDVEEVRSSKSTKTTRQKSNQNGSRPLTVGEIAANWVDGGMIRDTVRMKYHCNYKDPLPLLQEGVENAMVVDGDVDVDNSLPSIDPIVLNCITDAIASSNSGQSGKKVIISIPHESELDVAKMSLSKAGVENVQVANSIVEVITDGKNCGQDGLNEGSHSTPLWLLVCNGNSKNRQNDSKTTTTYRDIISDSPEDCTIHIVDSSWHALRHAVELYGDYIPRQGNVGNCIFPDRRLSLNLAQWATNCHPSQQSAATMNPWTGLLRMTDFGDLLNDNYS